MVNVPESVILHCSATPDDGDSIGASQIDAWHRAKGWDRIGYHFVVRRSGVIETGRTIQTVGAHCEGHNKGSIGVCYIGLKRPTHKQLYSIANLALIFSEKYNINFDNWFGHYEFNDKKECPGFSMELFRAFLKGI